jgi:MFS family permease
VKTPSRYRWFVVAVFFFFMLLHQSDKLLIGPLTTPIMETFGINEAQMGFVFTGALLVGAVMYPLWGYLYDHYTRPKLLALASLVWGSTTWLSAIAPTFPTFLATRASTGIDDSSYPGLYSLICDYFEPRGRGRVYGILQLTQPLGYLLGMLLGLFLAGALGWRGVFYLTGGLGIILAVVIFFGVRDAPRGHGEPELAGLGEGVASYKFDWKLVGGLFRKRSLVLVFVQGFFGVFPWNVITFWFFRYLEKERAYSQTEVFSTMAVAVLVLASGYFVGGAAGDFMFKRTPRGRLLVCTAGVLIGAVLLYLTLNVPADNRLLFGVLLAATALFMPFSSPNIIATVYDVTLPEVRSTAYAVESLIESLGAVAAPTIAGLIAVRSSLHNAILVICLSTWAVCTLFLALSAYLIPQDVAALRAELRRRAAEAGAAQAGVTPS